MFIFVVDNYPLSVQIMISDKTVLILGAGSSVPYGYPTMNKLRSDIIDNFRNYYTKLYLQDYDEYQRENELGALHQFVDRFEGSTGMIDEFLSLDQNQDVVDLGKLAIVCSLSEFEKKSEFREKAIDTNSDWYSSFYLQLYRNLPRGDQYKFWQYDFSVITFNYDRSFEYFIYDSLTKAFKGKTEKIIEGLNKIKVIHVYGRMAKFIWQAQTSNENVSVSIPYREIISSERHERCALNIDIMYNSRLNNPRMEMIREIISNAKRLLFVGFGFDKFNLETIGITEKSIDPNQDIFWTQYELEDPKKEVAKKLFLPNGVTTSRKPIDGNSKKLIDIHLF